MMAGIESNLLGADSASMKKGIAAMNWVKIRFQTFTWKLSLIRRRRADAVFVSAFWNRLFCVAGDCGIFKTDNQTREWNLYKTVGS